MKKNLKKYILLGIVVVILIALAVISIPFFSKLYTPENQAIIKDFIDSLGFGGAVILVLVRVIQIVLVFIPGEVVELACGLTLGWFWGLIVCLIGTFIGTASVFMLVRKFGIKIADIFINRQKINNYNFLKDTNRLEMMTFLLFLIPGTPKDALTYIVPLSQIKPIRFIVIATFSRIPSIVTSTIAGESIYTGNIALTIVIFAITAILGLVGILLHNKYINKKSNEN